MTLNTILMYLPAIVIPLAYFGSLIVVLLRQENKLRRQLNTALKDDLEDQDAYDLILYSLFSLVTLFTLFICLWRLYLFNHLQLL